MLTSRPLSKRQRAQNDILSNTYPNVALAFDTFTFDEQAMIVLAMNEQLSNPNMQFNINLEELNEFSLQVIQSFLRLLLELYEEKLRVYLFNMNFLLDITFLGANSTKKIHQNSQKYPSINKFSHYAICEDRDLIKSFIPEMPRDEIISYLIKPSVYDKNLSRRINSNDADLNDVEFSFKNDIKKISEFLADKPAVERELAELDLALQKYLSAQGVFNAETQTLNKDYVDRSDRDPNHRRLLSAFFSKWATAAGFDADIKRMTKPLTSQEFLSTLMTASLFKDTYFAHSSHGAWTHLIQWWCITSYYNRSSQDGVMFLSRTPAEMYRMIGVIDNKQNTSFWFDNFEIPLHASYGNFETMAYFFASEACKQRMPALSQMIKRYEDDSSRYRNSLKM